MRSKIILLAVLLLIFILGLSLVQSTSHPLTCQVIDTQTSTCDGATIFRMSSTTNAHAETPTGSNYDYAVCCDANNYLVGNLCAGNYVNILKLSDNTNAHVEKNTFSNYPLPVCISAPAGVNLDCQYQATCAEGYTCLASISSDTNAHIGDCVTSPYPTKVCCKGACLGNINGNVKDANTNSDIENAQVVVIENTEIKYSAATNPTGSYEINDVSCGTYDMIASASGYISSTESNVVVQAGATITVDFTLIEGLTCQDDCTDITDGYIHAECDGEEGCSFYDEQSALICDLAKPGWTRYYPDRYPPGCTEGVDCQCVDNCVIECGEGSPQPKSAVKAIVTCAEENLVKEVRIVNYRGQPTRLVVVVCGK